MLNLDSKALLQNKSEFVIVPMHKLTSHKLIQEDLKFVSDILELPDEIFSKRFFFDLKIQSEDSDNTNIKCYGDECQLLKNNNNRIGNVKIKFLINYYAASREYQKPQNKIILNLIH